MSKDNTSPTPRQALTKPPPKRTYHNKTRTGCFTCRIRRVKCDETKPSCIKCTSTGRTCDGYSGGSPPRLKTTDLPSLRALASSPCSGMLEVKAFEFFRGRTVPVLSGHFQDVTYSRTAPQLYHTEPAVRHAINAFGALHLEIYSRSMARSAGVDTNLRIYLPAEQYARALQELQVLLSKEEVPIEVVLTCSVLLAQFEGLQQDFVPAMLHAEKALSLLPAGRKGIDEDLLRTLMRLDAQSAMHVGRKSPQLAAYTSDLDTTLPVELTSGIKARHLLVTWSSRFYTFLQSVADQYVLKPGGVALEHLAQAQELAHVLYGVNNLLYDFQEQRSNDLPMREQHGLRILRARTTILRIFAATCLYSEATKFDAYITDFQYVLSICAALMSDLRADRRLLMLHVDEGLMHPLYVVATHCRDSGVRHKAFDLLRDLPEGNGTRIWHADVVIRTAKLIIEYEEAGHLDLRCSDVPEWRRVHHASFNNWNFSSWHETFGGPLRVRPNGMDGEWMDLLQLRSQSVTVDGPPYASDGA